MKKLKPDLRIGILLFSVYLSLILFAWVYFTNPETHLRITKLTQLFALVSVAYLYVALLAGPLVYTFRSLPFRSKYLYSRRALGVSAFYFALLHASFAFFGKLGGIEGLGYLSGKYTIAVLLGFLSLCILFCLTITSIDYAVSKLSFRRWKLLHRFVYLAGLMTIVHALTIGSHFQTLSNLIPIVFFCCILFLLLLEGLRIAAFLANLVPYLSFQIVYSCYILLLSILGYQLWFYQQSPLPFSIHATHVSANPNHQSHDDVHNHEPIYSASGHLVVIDNVEGIIIGEERTLMLSVNTKDRSKTITTFDSFNGALMHILVVKSDFTFTRYITPSPSTEGIFAFPLTLPTDGVYYVYAFYKLHGFSIEQHETSLSVGDTISFAYPAWSEKRSTPEAVYTLTPNTKTVTLHHQTSPPKHPLVLFAIHEDYTLSIGTTIQTTPKSITYRLTQPMASGWYTFFIADTNNQRIVADFMTRVE